MGPDIKTAIQLLSNSLSIDKLGSAVADDGFNSIIRKFGQHGNSALATVFAFLLDCLIAM